MTASLASTGAARVALAFSSLRIGGIQRVMLTLADGFLARGLQVDLVIVDATGELEPVVPARARVVDLGARRSKGALPRLVRYLRSQRPDAMLASQTPLNLVVLAAHALARVRTRVVLSEHVDLASVLRNQPMWKERLFPLLSRLCYPKADGLVVVSHATAARFAEATGLPPDLMTVIHNPVVTPDLDTRASMPVDHPWFAAGQPPVVLSAGRLTRQKDHETLLRAFARLRRHTPARLVILGDGEERRNLEATIERLGIGSDVDLRGFELNPIAYMARAALFVLSSRWEGFGNVLVEAMACGTPVVSTDCPGGPAEILKGGSCGLLAGVGDPIALADIMLRTLQRPAAPAALRQRALEFSSGLAVQRYLDILIPCASST